MTQNLCLTVSNENEMEEASFFNHACDPNAGYGGQIFLIALRDINKDEEVVFDYAMTVSDSKFYKYKMKCLCGSKNCRDVITGNDWKKPELQKRYDDIFNIICRRK